VLPLAGTPTAAAGAALATLWERVLAQLDRDEAEVLGCVHVGSAGDFPWMHTNEGEERVNLTLELRPDHLELNLVGWKQAQAESLKDWLQSVPGETAVNVLTDYEVVAYLRRAYKKTPDSTPYWQDDGERARRLCGA
jgi:hypothetical protein